MTRFDHAGGTMVAERDQNTGAYRRYVPGSGIDEPVVWYEGSGTTDRRWLHADERGSIIAASDGAGNLVDTRNRYDEYGNPQGGVITGRFGYTGQAWLPEIGMYYYRARIYNPSLGRFLQTDPIGYASGMNLYAYVQNDPTSFTDPSGLARICVVMTGSRIPRCVDVDADGDGLTSDNDLPWVDRKTFESHFRDFILEYGDPAGRNISDYGRPIDGTANSREMAVLRAVSQFVGAGLAFRYPTWFENWRRAGITANRDQGILSVIFGSEKGLIRFGGRQGPFQITITGNRLYFTSSIYDSPSDLARILLHEIQHPFYPSPTLYYEHHRIDRLAREALMRLGLGGGGCAAGTLLGGFPGC